MRRVLVYSHDTFGLGNIRRMLAISQALTEADPAVSVLILSGSPMLHAFRMPPRIDYVKLPCLARDTNGVYGVKYLDLDYQAALRLRSSLIVSAAIEFAPDVVLVDKKPLGVDGELEAALDLLGACERPPSVYLILRDILDDPEVTQRIWQKHDYHGAIERHYDGVLVAGCPGVFDVAKEYAFPAATREMTEHVGYLHRCGGRKTRDGVRAGFDLGGLPLLLVHAGGGGDGAPLIEAFLEGLHARRGRAPFYSWIISGPEMSDVERERLRARAATLAHVRFEDFTDDMQSCMQAADAVVSMGGYNTVCEVLSLNKPALIVPRSRPVKEQAMRAMRMAAQGYLACMLDADIRPDALIAAAMRLTMNGGAQLRARKRLPFAGLDRIADIVCRQAPLRPLAPPPLMAHAKLASLA
jgi:predicted glycosyltransferase